MKIFKKILLAILTSWLLVACIIISVILLIVFTLFSIFIVWPVEWLRDKKINWNEEWKELVNTGLGLLQTYFEDLWDIDITIR